MVKVVGIDLGTSNSAVAILRPSGRPEMLMNQEGDNTTPSVVLFQDFGEGKDEPLVGVLAKRQAAAYPDDVIQHIKRHIGDPHWQFDSSSGNQYGAEEISAIILKRLKQDAEAVLGETITDAVITVPAYFDDARRTATRQAGAIAGLNVLRVLNEPTAAALAYGLDTEKSGTVMVYDLGGGTFDVTILKMDDGNFDVLATDGDRNLGGFDFDNELMNFVAKQLEQQGVRDLLSNTDVVADLREKAEFAKKALSSMSNTNIQVSAGGRHYKVAVSRDDFEKASESLLRRTEELVEDTLDEAGMTWNQIDHVLLVGGSTRMPMVKELVERLSDKDVELDINPDEAVALGAAVQAALHENSTSTPTGVAIDVFGGKEITISDVTSQALGVLLLEGNGLKREVNRVVIPRNAEVPMRSSVEASTVIDRQTKIEVRVTQGDDPDPDFVTVIGSSTLHIPPYPQGAPIEITYYYDIDQTVGIEVFDLTTNESLGTFEIDRTANLDNEDVRVASNKIADLDVG